VGIFFETLFHQVAAHNNSLLEDYIKYQ
jgi:hypothetical protein